MGIERAMPDLPPDLDKLGDVLTHAVAQTGAARAHKAGVRRRLAGSIAAGLLVFAAMTPSHLGPADRAQLLGFAQAEPAEAAIFCDVPRGGSEYELLEPCVRRDPAPQAAR
jgi:hypothetical protein